MLTGPLGMLPPGITYIDVAARAEVDLRTLRRWTRRRPVREASARRIERALADLGIVGFGQGELAAALGGGEP